MKVFDSSVYIKRRTELALTLGSGLIILLGNNDAPRNYTDNTYRFRQDSNFLYYFGIDVPGLIGVIDADTGKSLLFGKEWSMDDIIWIGPHERLQDMAQKVGVNDVRSLYDFRELIHQVRATGRRIHKPLYYRHDHKIFISDILGIHHSQLEEHISIPLIKAIINQRSYKSEIELKQMTKAVNITGKMHLAAMQATKAGIYEYEVVSEIYKTAKQEDCYLAYPAIFSIHGEILHNHHHDNIMQSGQLALNDSGAETNMKYAGDITRTFPVNGKFDQRQRDIYSIVLAMEKQGIDMAKPDVYYREIHLATNKTMLQGLKDLGLLTGKVDDMLTEGVGGLFMPHGLGHMIGLDVHDMENLGEDFVGYAGQVDRSTQLGLKSLRLARKLEEGFVITVEPGIYFIPALIEKWKSEQRFSNFINYEKLKSFYDFGGIRIEDDVVITAEGSKVLGDYIPKEIGEIEDVMSA